MNYKSYTRGVIAASLSLFLIGCSTLTGTDLETKTQLENAVTENETVSEDSSLNEENATLIEINDSNTIISSSGATYDNNVVTISDEGTYILSGTASDFQILVSANENAKINIILNNVNITNSNESCINIEKADKVSITLATDSTNTLSISEALSEKEDADAVIYSKCDLTFDGEGSLLAVSSNNNAIHTTKDLVITSGNYHIESGKHGLFGKNSISIADGTFDITSDKDAIHTTNSKDEKKGFVNISGGDITICSNDDGIHAQTDLTIDAGVINITDSKEGLEASTVKINGGDITIVSTDDGINAAKGNDESNKGFADAFATEDDVWIEINGGNVYVDSKGDGLDSNGNLYVNGGTIFVDGPQNGDNGALDYNGEAIITGGVLVASGASQMAQNFGSSSTQPSIYVSTHNNILGDVSLKDSAGNVLVTKSPTKEYNSVVISCPDLKVGESYVVNLGTEEIEVDLEDIIYGETTEFMNPWKGGRPEGFDQMPEGFEPGKMGEGQMPEGFEPGKMGEGQMPEGFDPGKMRDENKKQKQENSNK